MYIDKNGHRLPTITKDGIYGFFGEYRWLSNYHPCNILVGDIVYPSTEHAYVAYKTNDKDIKKQISQIAGPVQVKKFGATLRLRPDWEQFKLIAMFDCLMEKFRDKVLQQELIKTGDLYLEESNNWNDKFYGVHYKIVNGTIVDKGEGLNMLGKMLMIVRERYR